MAPPICLAGIRDVDRFPLCRHFFPHWLSLLCTYTCARRFGYPQDTNDILRMPRYPQDASGILRIRYPQDTAVSSGYRVLRIPARVLGYGVPRIPPPILGICRCPQDAPRVPGRQLAFSDGALTAFCVDILYLAILGLGSRRVKSVKRAYLKLLTCFMHYSTRLYFNIQ